MKKLYIWYWIGGGYNSCRAETKEEALKRAKAMALHNTLQVDESSLHEGTNEEWNKLDAQYSSLFN